MIRVAQNPQLYFTVSSETPQPGGLSSRIYIPQEHGGPVTLSGTLQEANIITSWYSEWLFDDGHAWLADWLYVQPNG
jgi:hypothetical protein